MFAKVQVKRKSQAKLQLHWKFGWLWRGRLELWVHSAPGWPAAGSSSEAHQPRAAQVCTHGFERQV